MVIVSVTDERPLGLSLGAAEFFVKPVSAEKLLDALARVRARAQRDIQDVLVVDDEAAARESIAAVLGPRGYAVRTTASGEEALRLIRERPPDVAIVDLTMPGMSGFELVSALRKNPTDAERCRFAFTRRRICRRRNCAGCMSSRRRSRPSRFASSC